jgi:eukaryotic-like serine/threonine-protein kinase
MHFDTEAGAADPPELSLVDHRLGPYRIVRKLGSGGMGDVWLAERADQEYRQQVAIKLVRGGLLSAQIQGRLRLERQILATLQHPNIARLLDGGRAADGTPYLVMEYIDGEPIDLYCDRKRLPLAQRIALLQAICAAVHYAHQNLIVHRDLKPNNILVTSDGQPKLLDFGIAKLLETPQSLHTLAVTHGDYRVMTPAHASPEQIRGDVITTSTDIYVLGVLAYELLSGARPFDLDDARLPQIERIICEQEPLPPSARVRQQSPETLDYIVAARSTALSRLQRDLHGDLDNIILMAMRKEPARRYSSAEQLAADLQRHLTGQPVLATKDSWRYRTRKFAARHALAVAASAVAVLTLATFATVTFLQARRIAHERDVATTERTRAEQVSSFLVELFELSDPSKSRGNQVTARELLDVGARRISGGLSDQPETRARLLGTIGRVYSSLGLYSDSVPLLQQALESQRTLHGSQHAQVAAALLALADALCEQGKLDECEQHIEEALSMQRRLGGKDSLDSAATLLSRARLAQQRGDLPAAERDYEQSIAIYLRHGRDRTPASASVMNDLAGLHAYRGQYERAASLYRSALDIDQQALGRDHPQVAMHIHDLAVALQMQGQLAEAEPLYAQSTQTLRKVLGEKHPHTLDALANYGRFLHRKGDLARARQLLSDVVAANRDARGPQHVFVGHDLVNLAMVRLDDDDAVGAEADLHAALDIYAKALPGDHPYVASALAGLGRAQLDLGRDAEAEKTLRRAIEIAKGEDTPAVQRARIALASLEARKVVPR